MPRRPPDIFTERGITPPWRKSGDVAREQGFVHYKGADWRKRRAIIKEHEPLYGSDKHPDPHKAAELWNRAVERELSPLGSNAVAKYLDSGFAPPASMARLNRMRERLPEKARQAWTDWLRKALDCDGWLLPRHAVMPDHEERDFRFRPVAQLRPDLPVVMGAGYEWHHHFYDLSRRERQAHEAKVCDKAPRPGEPGHPHLAAFDHPEGAFLPTGHRHPVTGELVVPFADDEGRYRRHRHWDQAKYVYTPGDTAKRLGTNPVALERGWGGPDDLFVVVLEGTLKMCAVVEAGYPAIDAGSVTLWHGGTVVAWSGDEGNLEGGVWLELAAFAERHLAGRPVAVVCDSDWHRNDLVLDQTRRVVALLRAEGADAVACAPPEGQSLGWAHPVTGIEMRDKVGVDDWLGKHDRDLLDLVCQVPQGAATLTPDDPRLRDGTYRPGRVATARVLLAMGEMALPGTDLAPFLKTELAMLLGLPPSTVTDALNRGETRGLATRVNTARRQWLPVEGRGAMEAPLVRLTPEALPRHTEPTLGAWLMARQSTKSAPI